MLNLKIKLSNEIAMPILALGTWLTEGEKAVQAVQDAIAIGYRHIDTAQAYENEQEVGKGIRLSGIPRDEIFVTSKVAAEIKNYDDAAKSIEETLQKLELEYIDLMLIHCPQPWAEYRQNPYRYFDENRQVWKALEDAYLAGKIRAIGVSNFQIEDIENILTDCRIKPMVNQIECHVGDTPMPLMQWCKEHQIVVEAYSPIAHGRALQNSIVTELAEKYQVTPAQLCIRYCLQLGLVTLPKGTSYAHIAENTKVDFSISDEDMQKLMEYK